MQETTNKMTLKPKSITKKSNAIVKCTSVGRVGRKHQVPCVGSHDDQVHGYARITALDGSYQDGRWENGDFKEGKVKFRYAIGTFEGCAKDGKRHGLGIIKYNDGRVYDGEWKAGKRDGRGKLAYQRRSGKYHCYVGEWKNDCKHGKGKLTVGENY